jgi:hypothetical protein
MSILDQYAKQPMTERRTKTAGTKLEPTLYNKFVEHCEKRGLNTSEALRFLIIELLKESSETKVTQKQESKKQRLTKVSKEKPHETESKQKKTTGHLQSFTINDQLPCPICDKWILKKNYPRHCRQSHQTTNIELIQSHLEKVNQMVEQQREKHEQ